MFDITSVDNGVLVRLQTNRATSVKEISAQVEKDFKRNFRIWQNKADWVTTRNSKQSKVTDNRIFLATESVGNNLTGRPSKPNVIAGQQTNEAHTLANSLQRVFLEKYRELNIKDELRTGIRHQFFCKVMAFKMCWDRTIDDFTMKAVKPTKLKFGESATKECESEFTIEEIDDKRLLDLLDEFPEQKELILKKSGIGTMDRALEENPAVKYVELWVGNGVAWIYEGEVLKKIKNPYWDWKGVKVTPEEGDKLRQPDMLGKKRVRFMSKIVAAQPQRMGPIAPEGQEVAEPAAEPTVEGQQPTAPVEGRYETYLSNYFDYPRKPYIWHSVLKVEGKGVGDTSLMDQTAPLQERIDESKQQIADNAKQVNGITKFDTKKMTLTLAEARKAHYDPDGILYGPGVIDGVRRETGQPLPNYVINDLEQSIRELDNIFGTQPTFRGEGGPQETATGRAILREQSVSRLDEMISSVDFVMGEAYDWWMQFIRTKYTERHLVKCLGENGANETIEIMRDEIGDGVEVRVIPGQVLPEDRIFRAERAAEDYRAGLLDPLTYFEAAGGYDNPAEVAKRVIMFKLNPFSIVEMGPEDIAKMQRAFQMQQQLQPLPAASPDGSAPAQLTAGESGGQDVGGEQQLRARIMAMAQSPEFQKLPPAQKLQRIRQLKQELTSSTGGAKT